MVRTSEAMAGALVNTWAGLSGSAAEAASPGAKPQHQGRRPIGQGYAATIGELGSMLGAKEEGATQ